MRRRTTREVRYFVLQDKRGNDTNHVFTGRQPRQAALKAATRGFTEIRLRERGRERVHIFVGSRRRVRAPSNAPEWMPREIYKATVRKRGIEHLERRRRASSTRRSSTRRRASSTRRSSTRRRASSARRASSRRRRR